MCGNEEKMNTIKKLSACILTFALSITTPGISANVYADTQTTADTITVNVKVEDVDSTLIAEEVTLSKDDVTRIHQTFTVESGDIEFPVLTSEYFTAAHALGKYVADTSSSPTEDLTFSYGCPAHIKGEKLLDYYAYWSFRVNNESPSDEATGFQYTPDQCPIKDGDSIVFFRQACYDPNAGDFGAYTNYSWFSKEKYETEAGTPLTITYFKENGFDGGINPAAGEDIHIFQGEQWIHTVSTDKNGTALLTLKQPGVYTATGGRLKDGIPENSHASSTIVVTEASVPTSAPPASPTPFPANHSCVIHDEKKWKKPARPKKLKASISKKNVTFKWKEAARADGYQLFFSKKKKKNFKKFSSTYGTKVKKKFKKGTYFVKVRSYAIQNRKKVYSGYSNIVRVKIK